jgi:hypothetical protein
VRWATVFQGEAAGRSMAVPVNWRVFVKLSMFGDSSELGTMMQDPRAAQTRQTCGRATPEVLITKSCPSIAQLAHRTIDAPLFILSS